MAHYAFVDDSNVVVEVVVGRDEGEGVDWEKYYGDRRGLRCLRTSYHTQGGQHRNGGTPFRLNYAGAGWLYLQEIDGFVPPKPSADAVLDPATGLWVEAS
jgi:hypothetical protein